MLDSAQPSSNPRDIYIALNSEAEITHINKAAADFFKWQQDVVTGLSFYALCKQSDYLCWLPNDTAHLCAGGAVQFKTHLTAAQASAEVVSGEATIVAILQKGKLLGFEIVGRLCVEEVAHRYNNINLRELLKNLPGSTYWKDRNGAYLGCSDYVLRLANLQSEDDIVGKTDFELPWRNVAENIRKTDLEVMEKGKLLEVEEHAELSDGTMNYVMSHKAPLHNTKGDIIGVIGQSVNITELKETQKALSNAKEALALSNQAKSDFLDNMRHDIRTPISCILGAGRILRDMEADSDKLEWIDAIIESSESLHSFFSRILDYINVDSGSQPVRSKRFTLQQIIENVTNMLSVAVKQKGITLKVEIDPAAPGNLLGDEFRLQQVLLNLISNSIKFTHTGSVFLKVELNKQDGREVILQFIVQDTGVGISRGNLGGIFEKFNSSSCSSGGEHTREGLGLSIVTQYLHDLNGEIDVSSEEGVGSTFTCTVPFRASLLEEA